LCPACLLKNAFPPDGDPDQLLDDMGATLPEGATVGPFVISGLLGRGGMSAVYRAHDVHLTRTVALKVLPQEFLHDRTFARRFEHEARVIAGLAHDHIVPIYASGIDDGIPWMSMRLIAGGHLGARLEQCRPEPAEAIRILRCVAEALDYAHARGVVHRDIKPTNILLDGDGVYIGDFGLAQMLEQDPRATRTGTIVGTPHYLAPERALGERADHRCDIYSMGIVAYEMFVGRLPFIADSPVGVLLKHVNEPLSPPAGLLAHGLADALQRAAAKDPEQRWSSAGAFVAALDAALTSSATGIAAPEASARHALVAPWRRRRTLALIGGLATAVGLTWWMARDPALRPLPSALLSGQDTNLASPPEPIARDDRRSASSKRQKPPAPVPASPSTRAHNLEPEASLPSSAVTITESATRVEAPSSAVSAIESPVTVDAAPARSAAPAAQPAARTPALVPQSNVQIDVVTPPTLRRKVRREYPPAARAAELEGDVILQAEVGADGKVRKVTVIRPIHKVLADAARKAVLRYLYDPARRNGVPEAATVTETVSFRLD
jgi:TonB family protein